MQQREPRGRSAAVGYSFSNTQRMGNTNRPRALDRSHTKAGLDEPNNYQLDERQSITVGRSLSQSISPREYRTTLVMPTLLHHGILRRKCSATIESNPQPSSNNNLSSYYSSRRTMTLYHTHTSSKQFPSLRLLTLPPPHPPATTG